MFYITPRKEFEFITEILLTFNIWWAGNNYRDTHSTEKEMKDHFQTEDTLNNKEVEGSAIESLKCLYLCTGYFAQQKLKFEIGAVNVKMCA